jgi:hypothetical protein
MDFYKSWPLFAGIIYRRLRHHTSPHNPTFFENQPKMEKYKESTRVYPKVFGLAAWSENCK